MSGVAPKLYYYDGGWQDITQYVVEPGLTEIQYCIDNKVQGNAVFLDLVLTTECPYYGEGKYKLEIGANYILLGAPGDGIKIDLTKDIVTLTLVDYLFYILTGLAPLKVGAIDADSLSGEAVTVKTIEDLIALYDMSQGSSGNKGNANIEGFSSRDGENFYDGLGNTINVIEENIRYRTKGAIKGKGQVADLGQCYVNIYDVLKNIVEGSNFNYNFVNDYLEDSVYYSVSATGVSDQKKIWDCKIINGFLLELASSEGAVNLYSWNLSSGTEYITQLVWNSRDWVEDEEGEDFIPYQIFPDYRNNCCYIPGWYCASFNPAGTSLEYNFRVIKVSIASNGILSQEYVDDYSAVDLYAKNFNATTNERILYRDRVNRFAPDKVSVSVELTDFNRMTWYTDEELAEAGKFRIILTKHQTGGELYVIDPDLHQASQPYWKYMYSIPIYTSQIIPDWMNGAVVVTYQYAGVYYKRFYRINMPILSAGYSVSGEGGTIHVDDDPGSNTKPPIATWRESIYYTNTIPDASDFFFHLSQVPNGVLCRNGVYNNYIENKASYFTNNYEHDYAWGGSAWDDSIDRILIWSTITTDENPSVLRWDIHDHYTYKRMYLYQPAVYIDQRQQLIDIFATAGLFYEQKNGQARFFRIRGVGTNLATIQNSDFVNIRDIKEFTNFADEYSIEVLTKRITKESGNVIQEIKTLANDYGFVSKLNVKWFSDWTAYLQKSFTGKEFIFDLNHFFELTNTYLPNLGDLLTYDSDLYMITRVTVDLVNLRIAIETIKPISLQSITKMWVAGGQGTNTLAWSEDGESWNGLGDSIFSTRGFDVVWNGLIWVAVGQGTNSIAHSPDGKTWTGLGTPVFTNGYGVCWNGSLWVAGGYETNTLAWSEDGELWYGLGETIFTNACRNFAWNGLLFVAVGEGTNSIAWSENGKTWYGLGIPVFTNGQDVAWNGTLFVAVGVGDNSMAWSNNGKIWHGLGASVFTVGSYGVAWNGSIFVAVGEGTNTIAWSEDGKIWHELGATIFTTRGYNVAWNGTKFVAVGEGTNTIAYSTDGKTWTGAGASIFTSSGKRVGSKPAPQLIPPVY